MARIVIGKNRCFKLGCKLESYFVEEIHHLKRLHYSTPDIARMLRIHRKTVQKWMNRTSTTKPRKASYYEIRRTILRLLDDNPQLGLKEVTTIMRIQHKVSISQSTIWRILKSSKYSFKNIYNRHCYIVRYSHEREIWKQFVAQIDASKVVVVDEAMFRQIEEGQRRRGWGKKGKPINRFVYQGSDELSLSVIGFVSVNGLFFSAARHETIDGAFIVALFGDHIVPYLTAHGIQRIFVCDNASVHKFAAPFIRRLLSPIGSELVFVPAYSPDFQPIELIWALVKQQLKDERLYATNPWTAIQNCLADIPECHFSSCFRHCGYQFTAKAF